MLNWIRNLFRKRYINLGRTAYLGTKGIIPLFSLKTTHSSLKQGLRGFVR